MSETGTTTIRLHRTTIKRFREQKPFDPNVHVSDDWLLNWLLDNDVERISKIEFIEEYNRSLQTNNGEALWKFLKENGHIKDGEEA